MKTKTHKQNIIDSRTGGFGGSDAKMFYRIGYNGLSALTNTQKKRIRVAKGLEPYESIPTTDAMQRGHDFEQWYSEQPFAPKAEREGLLTREMARNFKTFAHADFVAEDKDKEVWELKCVQDPDEAIDAYWEQIQWYYMLGASQVWLVVCDSTAPTFAEGCRMPQLIQPDPVYINTMENGISLLDHAWDEIDLTTSDDWHYTELMPFESVEVCRTWDYFRQLKNLEQAIEEQKAKLLKFMQENNIRSIKSDTHSVVIVPEGETRTLDKSKLFKAHPEINAADFEKVSKRKAYVTIKVKEP